jgi:ubiquinone/menaquinone biosynthesis C-methylase UbiE
VDEVYTHGHHDSVLRSHRWRTAENSAAYLIPHLRSGMTLLDVGCGPGTITADLATLVAPGPVIGVDRERTVIAEATRSNRPDSSASLEFRIADVYSLPFDDESFDVVHVHQVLQHLSDPAGALVEMRRVLRKRGILAARESDYGAFVWAPEDPMLDRWMGLYHDISRHNGAQADAGRHLLGWVTEAGFGVTKASSSTWTFAEEEERMWWGELWAERVTVSSLAEQAVGYGFSTADELQAIARSWRQWAAADNGLFILLHAEVLAWR